MNEPCHTHTHKKLFFLLCHRAVTSYQLLRISKRFAISCMVLLAFHCCCFLYHRFHPHQAVTSLQMLPKGLFIFYCRFTTVVRVLENLCVAKTHARVQYTSTSVTNLPCSGSHSSVSQQQQSRYLHHPDRRWSYH